MAVNSKLNFDIFARDHASPVFNKFGKQVDNTGKSIGGVSAGTKKLMGAFAGAAVISKAAGFLRDANTEARESQKVNAQTAAALKSTGASAWASTKGIAALSASISKKTGIDDEAIQSGSNLLLTFKNVKNEAGQGAKIFDRATQSAVDLSAAGFGSVSGASKMLGKALNDPIKGISALGRAGVTFTQGQKDQIAAMVKAGDTLGAQKIIMKEVESQVAGSAAAQATSADKLKVSWANFKEEIGTKLLPVLDKMAVQGAKAIEWMSKNPAAVYAMAAAVGVLGVAFIIATAPISLTALAIAALVAGLVYAYAKFDWFKKGVDLVFKALAAYARFMWNNVYQPIFKLLVKAIAGVMIAFGKMLQVLGKVPGFEWAKKAGDKMVDAGKKAWGLADNIKKIPNKKEVKVTTPGATAAIKAAKAIAKAFNNISPFKSIKVDTRRLGGNAEGTNNWRGGLSWVGEKGPEIVDLPKGSKVIPAHKSDAYLAAQASSPRGSMVNTGGGDYFDYDKLAAALVSLKVDVTVGVDKRTSAKIVTIGTAEAARLK